MIAMDEALIIENPRAVASVQAEDPGLWFHVETATEAYLQRALRRLHAAIEGEPWRPDGSNKER